MIDKFLNAKHWQLFLVAFGIPIVFQLILIGTIILESINENSSNTSFLFNYFKIFPIIMMLFITTLFGWLYSIGKGLDKLIPNELKLNVMWLKFFIAIPTLYIIIFFIIIGGSFVLDSNLCVYKFLISMHLFSMFCIFYCIYFVAKTIKTAELQRKVGFGDFAGEFFLIWFFPIGVWYIQPKVNDMLSNSHNVARH